MRTALRTALVLSLSVVVSAAATAGLGDPLADAVAQRLKDPDLSRRQVNALHAARDRLAEPGLLADEMQHLRQAVTAVRSRFRGDATFDAAVAALPGPVGDELLGDRERVANLQGLLQGTPQAKRCVKQLELADRDLTASAATTHPLRALASLHRVAKHLRSAFPPQPDFRLTDVNPNTLTSQTPVSPRHSAGYVTAWYFGRAT